jgi:replicative DNA helicase
MNKVPLATEAEKGMASVAVNHPDAFLKMVAEKQFKLSDIFDPLCRTVCETVMNQAAISASCDVRVIYERSREKLPDVEFVQISQIYQYAPVVYSLADFLDIVRAASKRRALLAVLSKSLNDISKTEIPTAQLLNEVGMQVDGLAHELCPPSPADTKNLLMEAIKRYESGDDTTQRIATGYGKLDNLAPIRYGDFVVIGGETKSGKTMLALNIISNLLQCN